MNIFLTIFGGLCAPFICALLALPVVVHVQTTSVPVGTVRSPQVLLKCARVNALMQSLQRLNGSLFLKVRSRVLCPLLVRIQTTCKTQTAVHTVTGDGQKLEHSKVDDFKVREIQLPISGALGLTCPRLLRPPNHKKRSARMPTVVQLRNEIGLF